MTVVSSEKRTCVSGVMECDLCGRCQNIEGMIGKDHMPPWAAASPNLADIAEAQYRWMHVRVDEWHGEEVDVCPVCVERLLGFRRQNADA